MKDERKIRLLRADEIEIRVSYVSAKGISLLLYKDAGVDMMILDETFGITGWQRSHQIIDGKYFCTVSVRNNETGEWISKQDAGSESYADPVKGAASDSFKRACTNMGTGRELYSAPFIWIPANKLVNFENDKGKWIVKDAFSVSQISYNGEKRCITSLEIVNQLGNVVFSMSRNEKADDKNKAAHKNGNKNSMETPAGTAPVYSGFEAGMENRISENKPAGNVSSNMKITANQVKTLMNKLKKHGIPVEAVLRKHKLQSLEDMDYSLYEQAMLALVEPDGIVA